MSTSHTSRRWHIALLLSQITAVAAVSAAELIDVRDPRTPYERISPNAESLAISLSGDGRILAFSTKATDVVAGDTNQRVDIFVLNRTSNRVRRVVPSSDEGNGDSNSPILSSTGRFVAFESSASNFISGDTNDAMDVLFRDLQTNITTHVSVSASGAQANDSSALAAMTPDGRYIAFLSAATNLSPGDTNGKADLFIRDTQMRTTTRVAISLDDRSAFRALSPNGRYIAYVAAEANLFVYDQQTGTTTQVNVDPRGNPGLGSPGYTLVSPAASLSTDGRYIAFSSGNDNLVPGDVNGESDVFVRDMQLRVTTRIDPAPTRPEPVSDARRFGNDSPVISGDGRYVWYRKNRDFDTQLYVHDRQTGSVTLASADASGQPLPTMRSELMYTGVFAFAVSNGRSVAFTSSSDFVAGDTNILVDAFFRDVPSGATTLISRAAVKSNTPVRGATLGDSAGGAISGDGRYVVFESTSDGIVPGDTNGSADIFVRDRTQDTTQRVNLNSSGEIGSGDNFESTINRSGRYVAWVTDSRNTVPDTTPGRALVIRDLATRQTTLVSREGFLPGISDDGRYVAFISGLPLVPTDHNDTPDVYVRDRSKNTFERMSIRSDGVEPNGPSGRPAISGDGRYVAFVSFATNLQPGETSGLYLHDRSTHRTTFIARSAGAPSMDVQGRYIAFESFDATLIPGDVNPGYDVFVYDRVTGTFGRMNETTNGEQGTSDATQPTISNGGRYVSFLSLAPLVNDDVSPSFQLYVHDRLTGATIRSARPILPSADSFQMGPAYISGDGSSIAFASNGTVLTPNDSNDASDVFVEKRRAFPTVLRINAGGAALTDTAGRQWAADTGYNTGKTLRVSVPIANTRDAALYQDERYDESAAPELSYSIAAPNGRYLVRLHFAEINETNFGVGKRVFSIDIEGTRRVSNLDVFAAAGARKALIKSTTVDVRDGRVDIAFLHKTQNPTIAAIEIIAQ